LYTRVWSLLTTGEEAREREEESEEEGIGEKLERGSHVRPDEAIQR
jgi:hypothetical protein